MREILFRGKRIDNGEWIEGSLLKVTISGETYYFIFCDDFALDGFDVKALSHALVDPKTVGEYTGLPDKNGNRIFEGDVVRAVIVRDLGGGTENREETGIIGYDKIGMIGLITKYVGTIPVWSDLFQELTLSGCIDDFWFEVIGNIHDNPELLEVSSDA